MPTVCLCSVALSDRLLALQRSARLKSQPMRGFAVYVIDCETVHTLTPCHSLKYFPRKAANLGLCFIDLTQGTIDLWSRGARSSTISPRKFASNLSSPTPSPSFRCNAPPCIKDARLSTAHLRMLMKSSTILLGRFLKSDPDALQLTSGRTRRYHPRGRPLELGLA
jgi:hypothetical protein